KGACENCKGAGFLTQNLGFLDDAKTMCMVCNGKRFKDEVLEYTYDGKSITDVLALTMLEANEFFNLPEIAKQLQALNDVGLEYQPLGQPLSTLSGGEAQRINLATKLQKKGRVYDLGEPTTGLHMSNISLLHQIVDRLV